LRAVYYFCFGLKIVFFEIERKRLPLGQPPFTIYPLPRNTIGNFLLHRMLLVLLLISIKQCCYKQHYRGHALFCYDQSNGYFQIPKPGKETATGAASIHHLTELNHYGYF